MELFGASRVNFKNGMKPDASKVDRLYITEDASEAAILAILSKRGGFPARYEKDLSGHITFTVEITEKKLRAYEGEHIYLYRILSENCCISNAPDSEMKKVDNILNFEESRQMTIKQVIQTLRESENVEVKLRGEFTEKDTLKI